MSLCGYHWKCSNFSLVTLYVHHFVIYRWYIISISVLMSAWVCPCIVVSVHKVTGSGVSIVHSSRAPLKGGSEVSSSLQEMVLTTWRRETPIILGKGAFVSEWCAICFTNWQGLLEEGSDLRKTTGRRDVFEVEERAHFISGRGLCFTSKVMSYDLSEIRILFDERVPLTSGMAWVFFVFRYSIIALFSKVDGQKLLIW